MNMNNEKMRQTYEAGLDVLDAKVLKLQKLRKYRRNVDSLGVSWADIGTLGHVHELLLDAVRALESKED